MDDFCFNCFIEKMSVLLYIENIDVIRVFLEKLKKEEFYNRLVDNFNEM